MEKRKSISLTYNTDKELREFKAKCRKEGYTMAGLVGRWIREYIE